MTNIIYPQGWLRCPCAKEQKTKSVTLIFKRAELIYDAENYSFIEGDVSTTENDFARQMTFDIAQEGNVDRVTRVLNLTYDECVELLYPYTKSEIPDEQAPLDDILVVPEEYIIELTLPEGFSMTTVNLLKSLLHEYFVYRVLADWFSMVKPDVLANWNAKMEKTREDIRTCLWARRSIVRRPLKPF